MALSMLPGCGRYYWSKSGATVEQFTADSRACVGDAKAKVGTGTVSEDHITLAGRPSVGDPFSGGRWSST